jgi:hypothetical protein
MDRSSFALRNTLDTPVCHQECSDSCDETKSNEREGIAPFLSFRPVAEREKEAHDEQPEKEVVEDEVKDVDSKKLEHFSENDKDDVAVVLIRMR